MDILTSIVQFAASNPVLLLAVAALSVISIFLGITVTRQRQQIAVLTAPPRRRYGFLGKPLYAVVVVALFVGVIGFTYYANQNVQNVTVSADTNVAIAIKTQVLGTTAQGNQVQISVVPSVDGVEWGGSHGPSFDAFWTAVGPSGFSQVELGLTQSNSGGFIKVLRSGSYQITVDIVVANRRFNKTVSVNF